MKAYSQDLREKIVSAMKEGLSGVEVARRFGVCRQTVAEYWHKYLRTGKVETKQIGGYRRSRLADHDETLKTWISEQNDLTLAELQGRLLRELGITISQPGLWFRLRRIGLSYKKKHKGSRAGQTRTSGRTEQMAWQAATLGRAQAGLY